MSWLGKEVGKIPGSGNSMCKGPEVKRSLSFAGPESSYCGWIEVRKGEGGLR